MPGIRETQQVGNRLFRVTDIATTPNIRPILEEMRKLRLAVTAADWGGAMDHSLRCLGNGYCAVQWLRTLGGRSAAEESVRELIRLNPVGGHTIEGLDLTIDRGHWDPVSRTFQSSNSLPSAIKVEASVRDLPYFFWADVRSI